MVHYIMSSAGIPLF